MNNIQTITIRLDELYTQLRNLVASSTNKTTQKMIDVASQIQQLLKQI